VYRMNVVATDPVANHIALAFDANLATLPGVDIWSLFFQQIVRNFRTQDAVRCRVCLHTGSSVD